MRHAGPPKVHVSGGKRTKTQTKISTQAKTMKATARTTVSKKGITQATVSKQKSGATARTTVSKKGNTQATVRKLMSGGWTTVSKKGTTQATVRKQMSGVSHETGTKTPPAKAARPEKKGEGDWYLYDFFMLYSFKVKPTVPSVGQIRRVLADRDQGHSV
ncbi:uncharacterized protein LOC110052583 isoform X2 [Orbicella faveolata]|uniref:uncharacterized protein LOC110052583 isoform X2 n=1 Tax=Orbicella faveolata TaxID=48498 RepID=UPI0009E37FE5|nr:uncharacterized protein LOC110052583 isoform X2 [Orbicella faveolata]